MRKCRLCCQHPLPPCLLPISSDRSHTSRRMQRPQGNASGKCVWWEEPTNNEHMPFAVLCAVCYVDNHQTGGTPNSRCFCARYSTALRDNCSCVAVIGGPAPSHHCIEWRSNRQT